MKYDTIPNKPTFLIEFVGEQLAHHEHSTLHYAACVEIVASSYETALATFRRNFDDLVVLSVTRTTSLPAMSRLIDDGTVA